MAFKDPEQGKAYYREWHRTHKEHRRAYTLAHREEIQEQHRAWYGAAREERNAKRRAAYKANPQRRLTENLAYRANNRATLREKHRTYRTEHAAELKAKAPAVGRRYRQTNSERLKEKHRLYNARPEVKEHIRARVRTYYADHPEKMQMKNAKRRANKLQAPINDFTPEQWREMKEHYGYRCVYCDRKMERLTQDHITPLIKGGSHTKSNIVPACQSCNSKKQAGAPLCPVQPMLL